jgi:PAS domain S-box-containing protein
VFRPPPVVVALTLAIIATLWTALIYDARIAAGSVLTALVVALVWFLVRETKRGNVAERERHEDALRLIVDNDPLPKFVYCPDTLRLLAVNNPALELYGYSREQFLEMKVTDFHPADGRGGFDEFLRAPVGGATTQRQQMAWQHRTSEGHLIEVEIFLRRLSYHGYDAVLASVLDITEQRQAEKERDENREFLNSVIENVPVTIFVKEVREQRYILVNRAAEQLWGVSREKLIGRTAHDIFPKETAELITEGDAEVLNSPQKLFGADQVIQTPHNGVRSVRTRLLGIRHSKGGLQYLVGVIEDLTERKSIEEQLRQAQKMEALGNMTGGVAHDFNNLLTVVIGNLELLQLHLAGDSAAERIVETILQAGERGADLTRQMLAFSRRQPLQPKPTDVNHLIRNTTRLLARTLGENITMDVRLGSELPTVLIDESQLSAAVVNVAINARDAMPRGGTLTVTTHTIELDESYAACHAEVAAGAYVAIDMTDTGTGMPPEILGRIFDPFFTTKAVGKGTGLGLSMAYGFLKQSGGHISVYSEVGRGTTFKLYLPLAVPLALAPQVGADENGEMRGAASGEIILAVDDNADVRATVAVQLRQLGYQVLEAANAKAALEILDSGGRIDLLFTDVIMPGGIDGKELAKQARVKRPDLKVLFTSGFPGGSLARSGDYDENDVLLSKPYRQRDLARSVRDVLRQHA